MLTKIRALELANHRSKQKIGKWTGQNHQIHFMTIKRNKVLHNLKILEADLHQNTASTSDKDVSFVLE